ncbi:hypothetical protein ACOZ4I_04170 [Haloarcula salina]|uniref:hypothetical protein n=1 Tax=Haloarcula salina TaxID=1429914 RepID=UPI003C6F188B
MEYSKTDDETTAEVRPGPRSERSRGDPAQTNGRTAPGRDETLVARWGEPGVAVLLVVIPVLLLGGVVGEATAIPWLSLEAVTVAVGVVLTIAGGLAFFAVLYDAFG